MKIPLQITFEDIPASEAIETKIRQRVVRLARFCPRIVRCQVWVLEPQRGHHRKPLHSVRIRLSLPEAVVVVNPLPSDDIFVAIRDSFDAARRQLEDVERRRRGHVKAKPGAPLGAARP